MNKKLPAKNEKQAKRPSRIDRNKVKNVNLTEKKNGMEANGIE